MQVQKVGLRVDLFSRNGHTRSLEKALTNDEVERRKLSKALLPYVRRFYANYIDLAKHEPFYRPSSRV